MTVLLQTSFEDKETGQVLSAVDCYFQCQVTSGLRPTEQQRASQVTCLVCNAPRGNVIYLVCVMQKPQLQQHAPVTVTWMRGFCYHVARTGQKLHNNTLFLSLSGNVGCCSC